MSRYIPLELFPNILARLPTKDVLRCTAVCKSWYSIITSSSFTSLHLRLSNQTPSLLIRHMSDQKGPWYFSMDQNHTFKETSVQDPTLYHYIVDSFNGLCLLNTVSKDTAAVIWNPSLRKSIILPNPTDPLWGYPIYMHSLGFGFLSATNDYKIIRVSYPLKLDRNKVSAHVYELSTGSWRRINAYNFPFITYDYGSRSHQAYVKDIVHWPALRLDSLHDPFHKLSIGTFNMKNESFGTLPAPSSLHHLNFSLSTFQESLCLTSILDTSCIVWVMKEYGVQDSWTQLHNIDIDGHMRSLVYLAENGEILLETSKDVNGTDAILYDPKNNKVIKNIGVSATDHCLRAQSYMESLILLKGRDNNEEKEVCKKARLSYIY